MTVLAKALDRQRSLLRSGHLYSYSLNGPALELSQDHIIVRENGVCKVFSRKCTHLGCALNALGDSALVCPCHGSQFLLDGTVNKGPARKALRKLEVEVDNAREIIIVYGEDSE